jgi:hypothetical protein
MISTAFTQTEIKGRVAYFEVRTELTAGELVETWTTSREHAHAYLHALACCIAYAWVLVTERSGHEAVESAVSEETIEEIKNVFTLRPFRVRSS